MICPKCKLDKSENKFRKNYNMKNGKWYRNGYCFSSCQDCINKRQSYNYHKNKIKNGDKRRLQAKQRYKKKKGGRVQSYIFGRTQQERSKSYNSKHTFRRLWNNLNKNTNTPNSQSMIKPFDLWKLAKKQRLICPLTGRKLTNQNISPDHITHINNGGTNEINNIRLVCKEANFARHLLSDKDFINLCKDVVNKSNC